MTLSQVHASSNDADFTEKRPRPDYVQAEMRGVDPKDVRDERRPQSQDEIAGAILKYAAQGMARKDSEEIEASPPICRYGDPRVVNPPLSLSIWTHIV
jgi:hypothetical protein